jgi:hypothetical protein
MMIIVIVFAVVIVELEHSYLYLSNLIKIRYSFGDETWIRTDIASPLLYQLLPFV